MNLLLYFVKLPNEKEISRGRVVPNMLNLFRNGAVGFIDWLDGLCGTTEKLQIFVCFVEHD